METPPLCLAVMIPLELWPLPQWCCLWIKLFRGLDFTCPSMVPLRVLRIGVLYKYSPRHITPQECFEQARPFVEDKSISNPYVVLTWADCIRRASIGSIKIFFSGVPKASMTSLWTYRPKVWNPRKRLVLGFATENNFFSYKPFPMIYLCSWKATE
jgi:hypothetical protein